tara:strand:+ start:245 stop:535 length:291 start_codon:yes stop_codon:yes gene_type:complete
LAVFLLCQRTNSQPQIQWAELHFSDLGEAREHLDSLIQARKTLQSMKRLKTFAESPKCIASDSEIDRIDRGIAELESQESELVALINDCAMNDLFN